MLKGKRILLIVAGGIAAFKSLELIRRLRERGASVRCVLTEAGAKFVTPLSLQALSEDRVYSDMFSLTDESEMGHIQLSRDADLLVVAPATANILARMAAGLADDLAATVLLATDKPVLAAPAMNVRMWTHAATVANVETLKKRGIAFIGPNDGAMACNEFGPGRMSEPEEIVVAIETLLAPQEKPLAGRRAVVTSGPTREAIDPVRYISNHSSGKQGHAIASALARLGADVTLVSGPVALADPPGLRTVRIDSAEQMLAACLAAGRIDIAVCAAAVADWKAARPAAAGPGGGFCRRNREPGGQCHREAPAQGLRLDGRQRRVPRQRYVRRRAQHGAPDQRLRRRGLAHARQGRRRPAPCRPHRAPFRPANQGRSGGVAG
jgi:phosphopantothenoylcysteine decarboxylase/phosphopantothenate--cysteine ligase